MPFAFVTYRRTAAAGQLAALADVNRLLGDARIEYWLFGGWAVDFYASRITRPHFDVDLAVWLDDLPRITALLERNGWSHAPDPDGEGGTGYERDGVRLELTYLIARGDGSIVTPLRDFEATWPTGAFGADMRDLRGVRARIIGLEALTSGKSSARDDPEDATKDKADFDVLSGL